MKTLKQIADELGVSKQQVYRFVKAECINEVHHEALEAHQSKSVKYYDEAAENTIKAYFQGKAQPIEVHHEAHQSPDEAHHNAVNEAVVESLKSIIDTMQAAHSAEVERMQAQIISLQAQLDTERQHSRETADKLAQLADQSQRLQLASMQPPALLEDQQHKPTLWQRLFKRK